MDEILEEISRSIQRFVGQKDSKINVKDQEDLFHMINTVDALITLKNKEISYYNRLFCAAVHSVKDTKTDKSIDAACEQAKKEYDRLRDLKSSIRSLITLVA